MNLHGFRLKLRALFTPRRAERELQDELAFHLEREAHERAAAGTSRANARTGAKARFGSMTVAADECRDQRRIGFFDNLVRDIVYALRTFKRAPIAALTIIATVAVGLGLVTVVFTFLSMLVFRVDEVRNPGELFGVERPPVDGGDRIRFTRPQYEALVRETALFSGAFGMLPDIDSRVEGRMMAGTLVTGNFFDVLGVGAARGRTLTSSDEARSGGSPVVVLSYKGWMRHFAGDPGVVGRPLLFNGVPFEVVGVMPQGFRGLAVGAPDYWAPLSFIGHIRRIHAGREDAVGIDVIGRLRPGLSRERALAELVVWDSRDDATTANARRRAELVLEPRQGTVPQPAEAMMLVTPLFVAFGLILMIGCANVANLLLARGVARQREIGIRLATGASRWRIVCQLFTESLLLALVSAALAYGISRMVLSTTIYAVTSTIPPDIGDVDLNMPPADWRVAFFLVGGALVSTVFFALLPAIQATRVELVRAIRGEVVRDARPGRTRSVLIGVQVTASALLLVCSSVFLFSAMTSARSDPGFRTADTVMVEIVNEEKRGTMLDAVSSEAYVMSVAASAPDALSRPRIGFANGVGGRSSVSYKFVSPEYFGVLGIDIVRGRGFAEGERSTSTAVAIVAESTARQLWPASDPLGQVLQLDPDQSTRPGDQPSLGSRSFVVVGIARDVPGFRLAGAQATAVYVPIGAESAETTLTLRVHGDPELARRSLLTRLTAVDPDMGQVVTMRTIAGIETYFLQIGFWLTLVLGALALLLTLSGLFSVLSYLVEQRTREIGVRIALGATRGNICALVVSQLARPVGVGLLVGGSLAAVTGGLLLATPIAEQIGAIVRVFDPLAYALSLGVIISACAGAAMVPVLRAWRIEPINALRQD